MRHNFRYCSPSLHLRRGPSHFLSFLLVHHPSLNMMLVTAHRILGRTDGWLSGHLSSEEESMMERRDGMGLLRMPEWGRGGGSKVHCEAEGERFSGLLQVHLGWLTVRRSFSSWQHPTRRPVTSIHASKISRPPVTSNCPAFVQRL